MGLGGVSGSHFQLLCQLRYTFEASRAALCLAITRHENKRAHTQLPLSRISSHTRQFGVDEYPMIDYFFLTCFFGLLHRLVQANLINSSSWWDHLICNNLMTYVIMICLISFLRIQMGLQFFFLPLAISSQIMTKIVKILHPIL